MSDIDDDILPWNEDDGVTPTYPGYDDDVANAKMKIEETERFRQRLFQSVTAATAEREKIEKDLSFAVDYAVKLRDEKKEAMVKIDQLNGDVSQLRTTVDDHYEMYQYERSEKESLRRMYLSESAFSKRNKAKIADLEKQVLERNCCIKSLKKEIKELKERLGEEKKRKLDDASFEVEEQETSDY